jgi:hypothetical protein
MLATTDRFPVRAARPVTRTAALAAGARDFAAKPSRMRVLREEILHFWETHGPAGDDPAD